MKYRRIPSKKRYASRGNRQVRRIDSERRLRAYWYKGESIDFSAVFGQNRLEKGKKAGFFEKLHAHMARATAARKRFFGHVRRLSRRVVEAASAFLFWTKEKIREGIAKKRQEPSDLHIFAGALVGALTVTFLSAFLVLYKLLLSDFFGAHEKIVVPNMVGMSYAEAREILDNDYYNAEVLFEYSSSVPSGEIISQRPDGGAERKVFRRGEPCAVSVVVSRGKELIEIPELVGKSERDATLLLKNAAFSVSVIEEDAPTVPSGSVISSTPESGEMLESGGLVILRVSRRKDKTMQLVPSVCGLSEQGAIAKIRAAGFSVGDIQYQSSKEAAGLVISQDRIALTKSRAGGKISLTVSAGQTYLSKKVPSLYGLTVEAARERLAEYGLVIGNVYAADSNEPSGTVIAQSPSAESEINSSVVSVDMYVSR